MITEIDAKKEDNANKMVVDKEANQNSLDTNDDDSQMMIAAVRDVINELKEMYNEFLLQIKLVQKDLIRSAKYDELESKVRETKRMQPFRISFIPLHFQFLILNFSLLVQCWNYNRYKKSSNDMNSC